MYSRFLICGISEGIHKSSWMSLKFMENLLNRYREGTDVKTGYVQCITFGALTISERGVVISFRFIFVLSILADT